MGSFSIWHILILSVIVLFLFGGRGKISGLTGDVAKGIKNFRAGLKDVEAMPAVQQRHDHELQFEANEGCKVILCKLNVPAAI